MDAILVVPPAIDRGPFDRPVARFQRLGVGYVAAYALQCRHEVSVLNAATAGLDLEQTVSALLTADPPVIGMDLSYNFTDTVPGVEIIRALRTRGYRGHITAGGYTASFEWDRLLTGLPELDTVVIGEGEITFGELLRAITQDHEWYEIDGLAYRRNGHPVRTNPRALVRELDTLPFPV